MKKRRVAMADGRRYLIYYTFEKRSEPPASTDGFAALDNPPANSEDSEVLRKEGENV
ncbi:MAG: hypothetical protein M3Q26_01420 [Acidobacteriota bacterium]|nr:hypothetical protein [Acidobacteriota bacterium]